MIGRVLRAARFDARLYEELQADPTATIQALVVVLLSGLSLGFAGILGSYLQEALEAQSWVMARTVTATIAVWVTLGLLGYIVGRGILRKDVTFSMVPRAVGFASTPGVLYFGAGLGWIAGGDALAILIIYALLVWNLIAMTVAVRHTLQVSRWASFWLSAMGIIITVVLRKLII